jgi:hypothetical protein
MVLSEGMVQWNEERLVYIHQRLNSGSGVARLRKQLRWLDFNPAKLKNSQIWWKWGRPTSNAPTLARFQSGGIEFRENAPNLFSLCPLLWAFPRRARRRASPCVARLTPFSSHEFRVSVLVNEHERFALLHSRTPLPLCEVCKEAAGFVVTTIGTLLMPIDTEAAPLHCESRFRSMPLPFITP